MAQPPRLFERVRQRIRAKHYSYRTEKAYLHWIRRFILFHDRRHPRELGGPAVERFLTSLAVDQKVSASTQNQALSAILFLYREVLEVELPWLDGVVRARRPERRPVVLTRDEVRRVLAQLNGVQWLIASLLCGSGLRILECLQLRVKDISLDRHELLVRDGKGQKDRVTVLPSTLVPHLRVQVARLRQLYESDRAAGRPGVSLPFALRRKYPQAATSWGWQYVFPSRTFCKDPYSGETARHQLHPRNLQRCFQPMAVSPLGGGVLAVTPAAPGGRSRWPRSR